MQGTHEHPCVTVEELPASADPTTERESASEPWRFVAIVPYVGQIDVSRRCIRVSFPLGVIVLIASRRRWWRWPGAQEHSWSTTSRALLVGDEDSTERVLTDHRLQTGLIIVGVRVAGVAAAEGEAGQSGSLVVSGVADFERALDATGDDTAMVSGESGLLAKQVRTMGGRLEMGHRYLIVAPHITDIGGHCIRARLVVSLPLMLVETPRRAGQQVLAKRGFGLIGSRLLLLLLSLTLFTVSALVKFMSAETLIYCLERICMNEITFMGLRLGSTNVGPGAQLVDLLKGQGERDSLLFKTESDPRIAPVGRVLRKYSIDEPPQLINVFLGSASLIGSYSQREGEVTLHDSVAHRRLVVKPGMSGLWPMSGRSASKREDVIRLDLYCSENLSLTGGIKILLRAFKAIFHPGRRRTDP